MVGELSSQDCLSDKVFLASIKAINPDLRHAHEVGGLLLAMAIHQGSLESLQYLISKGVSVNKPSRCFTPLMNATKFGKPECVHILLDKGADIDRKCSFGESALHTAAAMKNLEMVKFLLNRGANVDNQRQGGRTPLMDAVLIGSQDTCIVQHLLDAGADVQLQDENKLSALHFAQTEELIDILVKKGACVNAVDIDGSTALHHRVKQGVPNLPAVQKLIDAGAEVNAKDKYGNTPLKEAVRGNNLDLVSYLLTKGADPNNAERLAESALLSACYHGNAEMVKLLHQAGARTDWDLMGFAETALHAACGCGSDDQDLLEVIRYLVEDVKVNVNQRCGAQADNKTAVHSACLRDSPSVLELLTNKDICDADLEATDRMGRRPIHLAAGRQPDCFQHLLNLGCDIHVTDKTGRNALHWAAQGGSIDTIRRILDQPGVDIDKRDLDGWTALCWAARGPMPESTSKSTINCTLQAEVVKLLLDKGADRSVRVPVDQDITCTPLGIAIFHDTGDEVIQLLTEHPIHEDGLNSSLKKGFVHEEIICDFCGVVSI